MHLHIHDVAKEPPAPSGRAGGANNHRTSTQPPSQPSKRQGNSSPAGVQPPTYVYNSRYVSLTGRRAYQRQRKSHTRNTRGSDPFEGKASGTLRKSDRRLSRPPRWKRESMLDPYDLKRARDPRQKEKRPDRTATCHGGRTIHRQGITQLCRAITNNNIYTYTQGTDTRPQQPPPSQIGRALLQRLNWRMPARPVTAASKPRRRQSGVFVSSGIKGGATCPLPSWDPREPRKRLNRHALVARPTMKNARDNTTATNFCIHASL